MATHTKNGRILVAAGITQERVPLAFAERVRTRGTQETSQPDRKPIDWFFRSETPKRTSKTGNALAHMVSKGTAMEHRIEVNEDETRFIVTTEGDGTPEGIIAFLRDIITHPSWKPGNDLLLDHRALRIDGIRASGVQEVSNYFKSIAPKLGSGRLALVMNRKIDFGVARAWEIITADDVEMRIRVFQEMEPAKIWLAQ